MSTTAPTQFRLSIGAKRQLTLPSELLEQLQVPERGELFVEIIGDHAVITPMVSMPRTELPEDLRRTFESRRGAHSSDIPLAQFFEEVGYKEPTQKEKAAAPPRQPMQERLASLTPNEKQALKKAGQAVLQRGPKRQKRLVEQLLGTRSSELVAQTRGQAETTLPEDLRRTFESRRGARPSDIPLAQFLKEMGYKAPAQKAAAPPRQSMQERLATLTPNERKALKKAGETLLQQGSTREKRLIEQMLSKRSSELIATRKSRPGVAAKAAGLRARELEEARSGRG